MNNKVLVPYIHSDFCGNPGNAKWEAIFHFNFSSIAK